MRKIICDAAVLIGLTACAAAPAPPLTAAPTASNATLVRVVAKDFAFDSSHTVPAGLVAIRLVNEGKAIHMLGVSLLDSGKTGADVLAGMTKKQPTGEVAEMGGPGVVSPGDSTTVYMTLEPGTYAMVCFVNDSTGKYHLMDGMVATLTVTGTNAGAPAEPQPDIEVRATDYHLALSRPLTAGHHLIRFSNDGPQNHDMGLLRLLPGKTEAQALAWIDHPTMSDPPVEAMGGTVGVERWRHVEIGVDLTPGDYLVLCFMPDKKDRKPHSMHGMIQRVHVS